MHAPIIERADLQSRSQKLIFGTLTCLFWLLWLHLWSPFIAELSWVAKANDAIQTALGPQQQAGDFSTLITFGLSILVAGSALIGWALYNQLRYHLSGGWRRAEVALVDHFAAARFYRIDVDPLPRWQQSPSLTIDHDDDGGIVAVHVNAKALPSLTAA